MKMSSKFLFNAFLLALPYARRAYHISPCYVKLVNFRNICFRKFMSANEVKLPMDRLQFNYARSSGPGGQNVNKLNTKAEVRFHVESADWLDGDTRQRLLEYQSNKISKEGDLIVTSQEHRTQAHNKEDCLKKIREMISDASIAPKDRKMYEGLSEKGKQKRKEDKRKRSDVKEGRRTKNRKDFYD